MNIQANLNAMLAMGAVAARTSQKYKDVHELASLKKSEQALSKIQQATAENVKSYDRKELSYLTEAGMKGANELNIKYNKELADIRQRRAEIKPNEANLKDVVERQDEPTLAEQKYKIQQQRQASQEQMRKAKAEQDAFDSIQDESNTKTTQKDELANRIERLKNDYGFEVNGGIN